MNGVASSLGVCLLGDCSYTWDTASQPQATVLTHLLIKHSVVIATIDTVYDVPDYCKYWRNKINTGNLAVHMTQITAVMQYKEGPAQYYLKDDTSNEDRNLRYKLYQDTLDRVLVLHLAERSRVFKLVCLFCPDTLQAVKSSVCQHLSELHNFNLGNPDNTVHFAEFIELLRGKMKEGKCFYCDKTFRDYKTLREHMRKKFHKKINADNKEYDKFYLVNYREFGKNWKSLEEDREERSAEPKEEDDWTEWTEDSPSVQCLLCSRTFRNLPDTTHHMATQHCVYFDKLIEGVAYYDQIKLINNIRYSVEKGRCPFCQINEADFTSHTCSTSSKLDMSVLEDERYLFPALDNDFLLCCLVPEEEEARGEHGGETTEGDWRDGLKTELEAEG